MNGGCFGKILTFILGVIVGIVLIAGTLAGVVYYAIAGVTLNDVESIADTKFEVISDDAEIRDKSLLEIFNIVRGGDIKSITVSGAKKIFGVDIIGILENTLGVTIGDDEKAELNDVEILNVFKGDNLKKILNCVTLRTALNKAGVDLTSGIGAKPIFQEHLDEPVIDGFNSILSSLEINDMTIAEMEYLLGISFGGEGVLNSLESYKISDLNNAINSVTFEKILPNFDRDLFIDKTEGKYTKGTLTPFTSYKSLLADGYFAVRADGEGRLADTTYYSYDEANGLLLEDDEGNYYVAPGKTLPDFRSRFSCKMVDGVLDTTTLSEDRFGAYYLDAGDVLSVNRYDEDGTQNNFGRYYYPYTKDSDGTYYLMYAAVKTAVDRTADPIVYEYEMVPRKFVEEGTADYFEALPVAYTISDPDKQLTEDLMGKWLRVHIGTSEAILKELADESLNTLDGSIGDIVSDMRLSDIIDVTSSSPMILQKLKDSKIGELSTDIKALVLGDVITIKTKNILRIATTAELADANVTKYRVLATDTYYGVYNKGYIGDATEEVAFVKDNATGIYVLDEEADTNVMIKMKDVKIEDIATEMQKTIDDLPLQDVIEISGDVYTKLIGTTYADALAESGVTEIYYVKDGIYIVAPSSITGVTEFYKKVETGTSNAVLKRIATITTKELAGGNALTTAVNDCKLSDVITNIKTTSILYQLKDSRIGSLQTDIQTVVKNATVNDINNWGNLGLTDLDKTIKGTSQVIGEMKIDEFLQAAINALKSTT